MKTNRSSCIRQTKTWTLSMSPKWREVTEKWIFAPFPLPVLGKLLSAKLMRPKISTMKWSFPVWGLSVRVKRGATAWFEWASLNEAARIKSPRKIRLLQNFLNQLLQMKTSKFLIFFLSFVKILSSFFILLFLWFVTYFDNTFFWNKF